MNDTERAPTMRHTSIIGQKTLNYRRFTMTVSWRFPETGSTRQHSCISLHAPLTWFVNHVVTSRPLARTYGDPIPLDRPKGGGPETISLSRFSVKEDGRSYKRIYGSEEGSWCLNTVIGRYLKLKDLESCMSSPVLPSGGIELLVREFQLVHECELADL
jgi:hypothetical protein